MENVHDPAHLLFLHTIPGNVGFTGDFAEPPEEDFIETPLGMAYIDTRRVGGPRVDQGERLHATELARGLRHP